MKFVKLLKENKSAVVDSWLDKTIGTYPKDSQAFLAGQTDQFANPVGNTHKNALRKLVDLLADQSKPKDFSEALVDVIKIRSIQDFSASEAVSFVLFLKDIIREVLKKDLKDLSTATKDLARFDGQVDQILLQAFEVYADLREQLARIRIEEVKRNVASLIKKTGFFEEI